MTSPWPAQQQHSPPAEHPWVGMAMLAAIPLLSLILIRMLWSGSSLWFLTAGIILMGAGAVAFLARRQNEQEYGRPFLSQEANRLPMVLAGLGVLFLVLLLLPNFAGDDDEASGPVVQQSTDATTSEVSGASQPPAQGQAPAPPAQQAPPASADGQTYVVQPGDTLFDIALQFGTTVDAIAAANELADPTALQVGDELVIPPASEEPTTDEQAPAGEDAPVLEQAPE